MNIPDLNTAISDFRAGKLDAALAASEAGMQQSAPHTDEHLQFMFVKADCLRTKGQLRQALEIIGETIDESGLSSETCALWHMHRGYFRGMTNAYLESTQEFDRAEKIAASDGLSQVSLDILLRRAMILFFAEELVASSVLLPQRKLPQQPQLLLRAAAPFNHKEQVAVRATGYHSHNLDIARDSLSLQAYVDCFRVAAQPNQLRCNERKPIQFESREIARLANVRAFNSFLYPEPGGMLPSGSFASGRGLSRR
jgi:hypothetical protein